MSLLPTVQNNKEEVMVKKTVSKNISAGRVIKRGSKRLAPVEQVTDRKKATGFGVKSTFEPLRKLSISQIRDLILASFWIDTAINTITDEVVKYDLKTKPTDTDIDAFLRYPSKKEPLMIVRKKYLKDMLRYGNGCCTIKYSRRRPSELIPAPGYLLRVTDDDKYKFLKQEGSGFLSDDKGNELEFTSKEIMHFQIDADSDATMARAPIEKIYEMVKADKSIAEELAKFVDRGFFMPSFISLPKTNGKDVEEFVEFLNNMVSEGAKIFGINREANLQEIKYWSAKDIIEAHRWTGTCVASVYKVPPFMLNLVSDVGSLNAREQKSRFLENVILPILKYESYIYTLTIAKKGFKKLDVDIIAPEIVTLLNYNRARVAAMLTDNDEPLLTIDEGRGLFFGLAPKNAKASKKTKTKEDPKE